MPRPGSRFWWVPVGGLFLVGTFVGVLILLDTTADTAFILPASERDSDGTDGSDASAAPLQSQRSVPQIASREERVEAAKLKLDELVAQGARSNSAELRRSIFAGEYPEIQLYALDLAYQLALKEGESRSPDLIGFAMEVPRVEVQRRALELAEAHPDPSYVPKLTSISDSSVAHRSKAFRALAAIGSDEAVSKITEIASREDQPKADRATALALLAKTRDPEALALLRDLANGSDAELAAVAQEVITAYSQK